jgi:flagellin
MTRINTNVNSLVAQNRLGTSNKSLQSALTRLSTGLRINKGSDDPAGLIASESLRSEITSLGKAISNTNRASQIISTADSALGEVSNLLNEVRGLVVEAANTGGLSAEEVAANQLQIDSSLEAINRIAQTTTFQGRKLLDGSLDFKSTASTVPSLTDIDIDQANLGATGQIDVEVLISSAAEQGEILAGVGAFTPAANATVDAGIAFGSATQSVNGLNVGIVGQGLDSIVFVNDTAPAAANGLASFDADSGVLTITGNFTIGTGTTSASEVATAVAAIDGFTATAAAGVDVFAGAPTPATVTQSEGLTITARQAGADFNNISVQFVEGTANSATYDEEQKILTVTTNGATQAASAIEAAIEAVTLGGQQLFDVDVPAAGEFTNLGSAETVNTLNSGGEVLNGNLVFQLNGSNGAETFNFGVGTNIDQIANAINLVQDATGVFATATDASGLQLNSIEYGTKARVEIEVISEGPGGTFEASLSANAVTGRNIEASINGVAATGDGNSFSVNTSVLDMSLTVTDGSTSNFSFSITDGGARFQLGPDVTSTQQARLGIGAVSTGLLGGPSGRLYELGSGQAKSLVNDVTGAANVIDEVIEKVTGLRGRLGAFQATTLESNLVSLNETRANLSEAESSIRDADFAQESANLTRAQILVQSGTNVLSLANQSPQSVLSLLG